jgi:flagellar hook protein FlgE
MMSTIHAVFSGLGAYAKQIEVSANNVANINTDGFKKSHTDLVSIETGGVLPVVRKDNSAGPMALRDRGYGSTPVELSNVDFGEETFVQIIGQRGFEANLNVLKTADNMLGSIIDIKE